ncbi:MAG: beta-ketoacyl-[acyl-carrier-protein] synthase family protein [Alphaproteobacteria bacterium]|nr:beta-ketoacyl-[acyl-carrier-protein] synthase family protein [Alphaproteobacteria bacterium]
MRRVAITGVGCICSLGNDLPSVWREAEAGRSAIREVTRVDPALLVAKNAAEVRDFEPEKVFDSKVLVMLDRASQFALVATQEALAMAGLANADPLGESCAVILGSGVGGMNTIDESFRKLYAEKAVRVHPFTIPKLMVNAPASQVTMRHGITGPAYAIASACSSANHAIGTAAWMVRQGTVDMAITGGTEAVVTLGTMKSWEALRVVASDTCRPFSVNRRGMVIGEGAGVFVLETFESAAKRGAPILAELAGFGMSSDAGDLVAPSADGAARAIRGALRDAGLNPEDIDYVNAHGTGTPANDSTETKALKQVFGEHAAELAISSTKAVHGHALGAAGALELAVTVAAMRAGVVPPTANYLGPDPACDLDYVPNTARRLPIRAAISNSFAFGGLNAVIAVRSV